MFNANHEVEAEVDPRTHMVGHAEIEVFAPAPGRPLPVQSPSTIEGNPLFPMTNLQPLTEADLGHNSLILILGFVVICVGIYIVKKLQLIRGGLINKSDRRFVTSAKRALALFKDEYAPRPSAQSDLVARAA